jgi:tetratricopeptide (TPR) repeat protein
LYDESLSAYAFARKQLSDDAVVCAGLFRKAGRVLEREGRYTQALRSYTRGVNCVATEHDLAAVATRAALLAAYGSARYRQGRVREAVVCARRSIEEAEIAHDQRSLAHGLRLLELCLEDLGDPQRLEYRGRSLPLYEALDDQVGLADELSNLGVYALGEGRLNEALDLFGRARAARQRAGDVVGEAAAMNNAAEALLDQGRANEALALLEPAMHLWRSAGHPLGIIIGLASLGRALAFLGETDRAVSLLDEAIESADALNAAFLASEIRVRKVEVLVLGGRDGSALDLADDLTRLGSSAFEERFVAMLHRLRGWSHLRRGQLDEAQRAIDEALARAEEIGVAYEIALALRGRAEIRRRHGLATASLDDARADALFADLGTVVVPPLLLQS